MGYYAFECFCRREYSFLTLRFVCFVGVFMSKEVALVLSGDAWDMEDEKTKSRIKGVSIWFLTSYREQDPEGMGPVGYKPSKVSGTNELLEKMRSMALPALCEMHYSSRPGAGGKATLVLSDLTFVKSVDVFSAGAPSKVKQPVTA